MKDLSMCVCQSFGIAESPTEGQEYRHRRLSDQHRRFAGAEQRTAHRHVDRLHTDGISPYDQLVLHLEACWATQRRFKASGVQHRSDGERENACCRPCRFATYLQAHHQVRATTRILAEHTSEVT
jgi:hypothetical protein